MLIAVLGLITFTCNVPAESKSSTHRVESPAYGQALYEYFQQNDLKAITTLLVAGQRAQVRRQADQSDLLLADLYYRYGLFSESDRMFSRLLSGDIDNDLLNRVWFNLARLNHEQGNEPQSLELLTRISGPFPGRLQQEKQYLLASMLVNKRDLVEAGKIIRSMSPASVWYHYARYNLGIGLIQTNRSAEGTTLLGEIGQLTTVDEEMLALRDQANLSLGLNHLRTGRAQEALESLQRIRIKGPLSHTALLATGRAWTHLKESGKALAPWLELARKNSVDAATHEALLAIPTLLEQTYKPKLAIQYYSLAAEQFDKQLEILEQSISNIKAGELISLLNQNALIHNPAKFADSTLQSASAPYLHGLLASATFHRELKHYQQLIDISASLNHWNLNLPTLSLMLKERRQRFLDKKPLLEQAGNFDNLRTLIGERHEFAAQLTKIEKNDDTLDLATDTEKDQLERFDRVAERLEKIGEQQDTSDEQDMHRLLRGLLTWQINTSYAARLRAAKTQMTALDNAIAQATARVESLQRISLDGLSRFDQFESRIRSQQNRISGLVQRVADLIDRQEQQINRLAVAGIEAQVQHIVQLRLNARYALARLYDKVVNQ